MAKEASAPQKSEFPKGLAESFALLKSLPDTKANQVAIGNLRKHIALLQNGPPAPQPTADSLATIWAFQTERGRWHRIEALARINQDAAWLLAEYRKLAPKTVKEKHEKAA